MKHNILKEQEPILIEEGYYHNNKNQKVKMADTFIITDGEKVNQISYKPFRVDRFVIGNEFYPYIDTVQKKDVFYKNANYIIKVFITKEMVFTRSKTSAYPNVREVIVYIKNPKDKKVLNEVNEILKSIYSNPTIKKAIARKRSK